VTELVLEPFGAEHLPLVQPWFEHDDVRRRLGGPEWPARGLELAPREDEEFRGARVLRTHTWLARCDGEPVGYLGGDVYDQWTTWDGRDPEHPRVTSSEPGPAMGSAYVVAPGRWREGIGTALLRAWVEAPDVRDVRLFALGIDADNMASRRCAERAGFRADDDAPDWEGTVYLIRRRARP
jgi:RimJ/RimL family protein N-acetyltransferase